MTGILLLTRLAQFACAIPIITGLIRYKHMPANARVFFYFMLFSGFTEWFAHYLSVTYNNNMPFLYVFTFVQFAAFSYVLLPTLNLSDKLRKYSFRALMALMLCLLIIEIVVHSVYKWNTISRTTESILVVFMSLAYILQHILSNKYINILKNHIFWITAGAITYFSVSFFFTLFYILETQNQSIIHATITIHLLANIIAYLCYAYSFWVATKPENINNTIL